MRGIVYGIGVGPGDPELMTLKAVRLIRETEVVAFTGNEGKESVAYQIAAAAVPEIADKKLVPVRMPMLKERTLLEEAHRESAEILESYLEQGLNVAFLTLGDPTIYSTFSYLQHILEKDEFQVNLVSGIPSFCAAAARMNLSLTEWNEELRIVPALHNMQNFLEKEGTYVFMKSGSRMKDVKDLLRQSGFSACAVENCGMEGEQVYPALEEIPDDAGYYSLIIARYNKNMPTE